MNRRTFHWIQLTTLCSLCCIAFSLAACGLGGPSNSTSIFPSGGTGTTPAAPFSGAMHTYTGMGIRIKYPANWVASSTDGGGTNGGGIRFREPGTTTTFALEILPIPFFSKSAPADAVKNLIPTLQKEGSQTQRVPLAPTATVGGQTWNQAAGTTEVTQGGQPVLIEQVMLATNHPTQPPDARVFILTYTASARAFDPTNTSIFQPMLQSFQFTR